MRAPGRILGPDVLLAAMAAAATSRRSRRVSGPASPDGPVVASTRPYETRLVLTPEEVQRRDEQSKRDLEACARSRRTRHVRRARRRP